MTELERDVISTKYDESQTKEKEALLFDSILMNIGTWYDLFRQRHFQFYEGHYKKCAQKRKLLEAKYSMKIFELQKGETCEKSDNLLHFQDWEKWKGGIGSSLHRIAQCIAVGLQKGYPCFVDDSSFAYSRKHFADFFANQLPCKKALTKNKRIDFNSTLPSDEFAKFFLPAVPDEIKNELELCHEDVSVWYTGVII